jgi:hypothetical protein
MRELAAATRGWHRLRVQRDDGFSGDGVGARYFFVG